MLFVALIATAVAAPPEGVDLDDLDTWEARAAAAIAGPPGCWVLEGDLTVSYTAYSAPSVFRRMAPEPSQFAGTFSGRIEDARWTTFRYTLDRKHGNTRGTEVSVPIWPLMGTIDTDVPVREASEGQPEQPDSRISLDSDGGDALNLLHHAIESIDPATTTSWAEWREADHGVRLMQDVPMSDGAHADTLAIATLFPDGGAAGTEVDVAFPRKIQRRQGLMRFSVYDAQMHLRNQRVGERVLPAKESVSAGIGAFGFTMGYEQQLTYRRATACTD